ncbi:uncharacterized protein LOC128556471 [Mercenaria mercenaria]|uniref:uncharacterized protein LOC128556471 n=1 Tax=Mercenaria mercenaria TaxID=6596 RepID=UPI00234FA77E|nr:uncharacterized protein LOC128556471 [Mercenaria mercenaria]
MARKKTRFYLSTIKQKRRNKAIWSPFKTENRNEVQTPMKENKRTSNTNRDLSPSKRLRTFSPCPQSESKTPEKTKRLLTPTSSTKKSRKKPVQNKVLEERVLFDEMSEELTEEEKDFLDIASDKAVLRQLSEAKILHYLTIFLTLIKLNKYPLANIAFLLWLETVKWYNCNSLQEMRFFKITKDFWRAGYRLFRGKFLCFMSGPRAIGSFLSTPSSNRKLDPEKTEINFAIPSRNTFVDAQNSDIPSTLSPGIIHRAVKAISDSPQSKVNMMCLDAKKVTAGLDDTYGDVDMFGHEARPNLNELRDRLQKEKTLIDDIKIEINEFVETCEEPGFDESDKACKKMEILDMIRALLLVLTLKLKEARTLKRKQEYGLEKLKERAGPEWKTSKYIFAISSIQAFLYRVKHFISRALLNIDNLCEKASALADSKSYIAKTIEPSKQKNLFMLKPVQMQLKPIPTIFIKQGSNEWKEIRKLAPVTGSTLHNALGLRTLSIQKQHFDTHILSKEGPELPEAVQVRLKHGTENEPNAVATLVGKFLPVFHPDLSFIEVGCCLLSGNVDFGKPLIAVSPDGSLCRGDNNNERVAAIEIKCPYPKTDGETLFYTIPQYYICQCLAEMKALDVMSLIFICYTKESSTFFEVDFDEDLWLAIQDQAELLYGKEQPERPSRKSPVTSELKKKLLQFSETNVRLLSEIPSASMSSSNIDPVLSHNQSPYIDHGNESPSTPSVTGKDNLRELLTTLNESNDCVKIGYQLSRRKANEVMVWVLSNKDRHWSAEIPNSMIVAFGLKDYKLSNEQLRAATEDVLNECKKAGLEIPLLAFDGQWYQIMVRDGESQPLTKLQLQKDVWNEVTKMKKKDIVDKLIHVNKPNMQADLKPKEGIMIERRKNEIVVTSNDIAFTKITTNRNIKYWTRSTNKSNDEIDDTFEECQTIEDNMNWIPDNVIDAVEKNGDAELMTALNNISRDINNILTAEKLNSSDADIEETQGDPEVNLRTKTFTERQEQVDLHLKDLSEDNYKEILTKLQNCKRHEKWKKMLPATLKELMVTATKMVIFTKEELCVIGNTLKTIFSSVETEFKGNWTKEKLINTLCGMLGNGSTVSLNKKVKKVPTLKKMAEKVLRGKTVPKQILNIAYAQYVYPSRLAKWQAKMPLDPQCQVKIDNNYIPIEWYSYPEINKATGALLCKTLDSHHLLTNLRIRTSTTGLQGISPEAWKKVASSFQTKLTPAMVDDLTDKQSNSFAQTHFSREVEDIMVENGDLNEAELCHLIRRWYEAEDQPALSASERVIRWLELRDYLLKDVDFSVFPPASLQLKGFSTIGFEGFLVGIDTKIQLLDICGPYCVRTVSSLPAETAVGGIQDMNFNKSMSVKAKDVPRIISALTEVMTYKCNPNRGFHMRTSRSSVYPVVEGHILTDNNDLSDPEVEISETEKGEDTLMTDYNGTKSLTIVPVNHAFDQPERRRTKARRKLGGLTSDLDAPPKGTLPMRREFHKCDESKVLPNKRSQLSDS